jgi:hypothetical protein
MPTAMVSTVYSLLKNREDLHQLPGSLTQSCSIGMSTMLASWREHSLCRRIPQFAHDNSTADHVLVWNYM